MKYINDTSHTNLQYRISKQLFSDDQMLWKCNEGVSSFFQGHHGWDQKCSVFEVLFRSNFHVASV